MPPEVPFSYSEYLAMGNVNTSLPDQSDNLPEMVDGYLTVGGDKPSYSFRPDMIQITERPLKEALWGKYEKNRWDSIKTVKQIADKHNLDFNFLLNVANKESKFDTSAKNRGVLGLFQFSQDNWREVIKNHKNEFNFTDNGRSNALQSATAAALNFIDIEKANKERGFPTDPTSLYLSHFLGRTGARRFFNKFERVEQGELEPNESEFVADDMPAAASQNPSQFYHDHDLYGTRYPMTYQEFFDNQRSYFDEDYTKLFKEDRQ